MRVITFPASDSGEVTEDEEAELMEAIEDIRNGRYEDGHELLRELARINGV